MRIVTERKYRRVMRALHEKTVEEITERKPGAISRLADLNRKKNEARTSYLLNRRKPA